METYKVVLFSLFWLAFFCFGSIETQKLAVLVKIRNNRNKHFVSDSAETSIGSIFGCFESKLVSMDTLLTVQCIHYLTIALCTGLQKERMMQLLKLRAQLKVYPPIYLQCTQLSAVVVCMCVYTTTKEQPETLIVLAETTVN